MKKKLLALLCAAAAVAAILTVHNCGGSPEVKPTKNLIVMISDGTSTGLLSLVRWYKHYTEPQENLGSLAVDPYLRGLMRTFNSDAPIAESSGSMSAYMTGVLQQGRNISVYPHSNPPQDLVEVDMSKEFQPLPTLLEAAKIQQGKSVGVVATVTFTHATPAATAAHSVERSNDHDISRQMASNGLDVLFAGGSSLVDEHMLQILKEQGISYYDKDIEGFRNHKDGKIWATFNDGFMDYEVDRGDNEPSLTEMSLKAIELLSKNKNGFFLMIEGSKVDIAAHSKDPFGAVTEYVEFDRAVAAVLEFARKDGNTTVVVTADHGTGGIQMGDDSYQDYSKKGLDSMFINFKKFKASGAKMESLIKSCDISLIPEVFKEYTGIELKPGELDALVAHRLHKKTGSGGKALLPSISEEINHIMTSHTHIGVLSGRHTGEDVYYAVYNPNAQTPIGYIWNKDIFQYMRQVLGFKKDLDVMKDEIYIPHYELFKGYKYSINEGEDGPVLEVEAGDVKLEAPSNRSFVLINGEKKVLESVVPYIKEHKVFYLPAAVKDLLPAAEPAPRKEIPVLAWCSVRPDDTPESFREYLQGLKDKGITGVCVNSSLRDREKIAMAAAAAGEVGLVYHAWLPCMLQGGMPHSWYAVNALGQSADTHPAYVEYYKALDPNNPEVIDWIVKQYTEIAQIPGVDYVQLDYIRYPDVKLSRGLWEKYGLDMTDEYKPADYCYCKRCLADFEERYGRKVYRNPSKDSEWAQFRQDVITNLVNKICESVHAVGKKVSADVFPGPYTYAVWMVRQEWDKWNIDEVFPMNYNDFYLADTKWLGRVTGEEVRAAGGKPVYSGLFICRDWQNKKAIIDPEGSGLVPSEIESAVIGSMESGAAGICLFTPDSMTPEHWDALKAARELWVGSAARKQ